MTVAIQYSRPNSSSESTIVYGLDVAVSNLLRAYFRYSKQPHFYCRPNDTESYNHFCQLAREAGHNPEDVCSALNPHSPRTTLNSMTTMFRADPLVTDLMWRRQQLTGKGFATCGLVHTMSGERIIHAVNNFCLSPSLSSDALICPSPAIRDAVQKLWQIYADYLGHHFKTHYTCPVQTPVIPLGIDTDRFARITTESYRQAQRAQLHADHDDIIILCYGRMSFATKAHPLPLWQAVQKIAALTSRKIRVVMFGYFKPKDMETRYRELAKTYSQQIPIDFIMNDDPRFPEGLWAAADIFVSLADNIQESFGLTPIEAMAAGLPIIASDWDGYRATIRDGVDGFLIPTMTPPAIAGHLLAEAYFNQENYGLSLVGAAQSTMVDPERVAASLYVLATNDDLRRSMAQSARSHAQKTFDWRHIIPQYEALWQEQARHHQSLSDVRPIPDQWPAAHPSFPNPFVMFESFPSTQMHPDDLISVALPDEDIQMLMAHDMNFFLPEFLLSRDTIIHLMDSIRHAGTPRIADILNAFDTAHHAALYRVLGWMLKHGIALLRRPV